MQKTFAPLFFIAGIISGIWFWFFMNVAKTNLVTISLFMLLTDEEVQRFNGLSPMPSEFTYTAIPLTIFLAGAVFAGVGHFIKR